MRLKVLSWNIWVDGDFDEFKQFMSAADADIIGLQEVKDDDSGETVLSFLNDLGYEHVFMPVETRWGKTVYRDGPAIFSRHKMRSSKKHILSKEEARGAVETEIKIGDEVLHVFSTHLFHTHQKPSPIQDEQVESLIRLLPKERTIVMGDFNATPESATIQKMLDVLNPSEPSFAPTWSNYPEGCPVCKPQGIDTRLDYIFATQDLKLSNPMVERSPASDHLPVTIDIEF